MTNLKVRRGLRVSVSLLGAMTGLLSSSLAHAQTHGWTNESAAAAEAEPNPGRPARPPHTARAVQFGVGFRYGASMTEREPNGWGSGIGADLGYTLPSAIYLGGNFEYFFGGRKELGAGISVKGNIWQLSAEGGYDVAAGKNFVIRPKLGVGIATANTSFTGCPPSVGCDSSSETKPLVAPGITFMLFTKSLSFSLDLRTAFVIADSTPKALILGFGIGL